MAVIFIFINVHISAFFLDMKVWTDPFDRKK